MPFDPIYLKCGERSKSRCPSLHFCCKAYVRMVSMQSGDMSATFLGHSSMLLITVKRGAHCSAKDLYIPCKSYCTQFWGALQCWVFKCIQELFFLQPRISLHPFYSTVKAAQLRQNDDSLLHLVSCATAHISLPVPACSNIYSAAMPGVCS